MIVHHYHWKTMPRHEQEEALEDGFACSMEKNTSICRRCGGLDDLHDSQDWATIHKARYDKWLALRKLGYVRKYAAREMELSFDQLRQSIRYVEANALH